MTYDLDVARCGLTEQQVVAPIPAGASGSGLRRFLSTATRLDAAASRAGIPRGRLALPGIHPGRRRRRQADVVLFRSAADPPAAGPA